MEDTNKYEIRLPDVKIYPEELYKRGGRVKQKQTQRVSQKVSQNVKIILGDILGKKRKKTKKRKPTKSKQEKEMGDTVSLEIRERPDALIHRTPQEERFGRYAYSGLGLNTYRLDAPKQSFMNPPSVLQSSTYSSPSSAVSSVPDFKRGEGVGLKIYEQYNIKENEKAEKLRKEREAFIKEQDEKKKAQPQQEVKKEVKQSLIPRYFKPIAILPPNQSKAIDTPAPKSVVEEMVAVQKAIETPSSIIDPIQAPNTQVVNPSQMNFVNRLPPEYAPVKREFAPTSQPGMSRQYEPPAGVSPTAPQSEQASSSKVDEKIKEIEGLTFKQLQSYLSKAGIKPWGLNKENMIEIAIQHSKETSK